MKLIEFELTMPNCNSWNGRWSGEGRKHLIYKRIYERDFASTIKNFELGRSFYYNFGDGWGANIKTRLLNKGERPQKSDGFCGYGWMVESILRWGKIVVEVKKRLTYKHANNFTGTLRRYAVDKNGNEFEVVESARSGGEELFTLVPQ